MKMSEDSLFSGNDNSTISAEDLKKLLGLLENIKFGSVTLVIQNGRVVQIEKNQKVRLK